ncbi:hypothetical protein N8444_03095 [Pelagibacteraceae bacterium]|nr:hypothetical protein [Pelagibacteraceae bacterium]
MKILDASWDKNNIEFKVLASFKKGIYGIEVKESTGLFKSQKHSYETKDIVSIGVVNEESEKSKSFTGSAVGAGLGGLVLGPVGLIAGALAGGNKKNKVIKLGIKFKDKNWILVEYNTKAWADRIHLNNIQEIKLTGKKKAPF